MLSIEVESNTMDGTCSYHNIVGSYRDAYAYIKGCEDRGICRLKVTELNDVTHIFTESNIPIIINE